VNAAYLAAELTTELEFAPGLGEDGAGALASPPTVLGSRDLKGAYDVTIPGAVWTFWNVLVHERRAAQVMETAISLARQAADRAGARMAERAARLRLPVDMTPDWRSIPVLTYAQVAQAARERDASFGERFAALAETLRTSADLDLPTRSRRLFEEVWSGSGLSGPAIVLGFGSMPYPAIHWPHEPEIEGAIRGAMAATAERFGVSIGATPFFPAIADMSFLGPVDAADLAEAARQTPLWGSSIQWDLTGAPTPGFPLVNIGPWGRDYHHWLERVHAPYAFEVLPSLIQETVRRVLGSGAQA
jgi:arginine utilization protein RocB